MTQTASGYARALWELEIPRESIEETLAVFEEEPSLEAVLSDPTVHLEDKEAAADRIFPEETRNFIKVLCKNHAVGSLGEIVREYRAYDDAHRRVVSATLAYVNPPNAEQMEGIKRFLLKTYDAADVDLTEQTDPSIMGGFILTVGDQEYDWSLRGRIEAMGKQLAGGEDR